MGIYDHAMSLSCDTGWNNCSLVHLLCNFIDQAGVSDKASAFLDAAAAEEMAEMEQGPCEECSCDPCDCENVCKQCEDLIEDGYCLGCGAPKEDDDA